MKTFIFAMALSVSCAVDPTAEYSPYEVAVSDEKIATEAVTVPSCLIVPCPAGATCTSSGCVCGGVLTRCDDSNDCTNDKCVESNCVHPPAESKACDGGACLEGVCRCTNSSHCDDDIPCTLDTCTSSGCVNDVMFEGWICHVGFCTGTCTAPLWDGQTDHAGRCDECE